jgi:hypothetical protein
MLRRVTVTLWVAVLALALPAAAAAAEKIDKPEGADHTLTTIFIVAASIPVLLGLLSIIDVARGEHTRRPDDH